MKKINRSRYGTTWINNGFDGRVAIKNMEVAFDQALAKYPDELSETFFIFGGKSIRVRIVGRELAEHICRPFSHLRADVHSGETPKLSIDFLDESKINANPSLEDQEWTERTVKSSDDRFIGQQLPNTISCLDLDSGHIMSSIAWKDRIFIYERAKPLARLLLEWHNALGIQVIHTGLVARDGQGVLFCGKSGSGKSTCSLLCVSAGFQYLSEDYVGLQYLNDDSFVGHSIYNSVFLQTAHLSRFTELAFYAIKGRPPQEEKSVIILSQVFPERLERVARIRALALPVVTNTPQPRIRPATKGEALLALGPSSLLQIPNRALGTSGFKMLVKLVEHLPCYWLELGTETEPVPDLVDDILAKTLRI